MAWAFNKGDLSDIAAIAQVHPNPVQWWTTVEADASDMDVQALATQVLASYAAGGRGMIEILEDVLEELRRIGDTEAELEVTRIDEDASGSTVTFQAKGKGFIT
jgi:hypothetical protein